MIENLLKKSNKIALIDDKFGEISYSNLKKETESISNLLESNSLTLLIADNKYEFIKGYLGFLKKKKTISILLDISLSDKFYQKIFKKYKPNYVFCPRSKNHLFNDCKNTLEMEDYNILKSDFNNNKDLNFKNFLLLPTSGTTQSPKLVRLSKKNLSDNVIKILKYLKINKKNNTTITTMPLGYSYGLSIIHTHLYSTSKIVLNNKSIFERGFWDLIEKNNVNSLNGVPEFFEYLKKLNFEKRLIKSIKYITQAGGKMSKDTLLYFGKLCKKNKIKLIIMYGQTEASPRMSFLEWKDFFLKFRSIGKPLEGYKIKLVDNKKKVIKETMKSGEIVFFGKNVSLGYCNSRKDLKKGDENKGKLYTGDLAYKDNDNYFFVVGRNNRTIKLFGKRFNLDDVEKYFKKKDLIVKCKFEKSKIILLVDNNFKEDKEVDLLSNFLNINKNFIIVKEKTKSFKNYQNVK
jgi:acyl-coenzyme A synthetase/AMP-(fatty) acid ligase